MAQKQHGATKSSFFVWILASAAVISVLTIAFLAVLTVKVAPSFTDPESNPKLQEVLEIIQFPVTGNEELDQRSEIAETVFNQNQSLIRLTIGLLTAFILILIAAIILLLIIFIFQMYLWQKDRRKLEQWREMGFMCERLEFLPANRLKLNSIELDLNKTQIENLKKLATNRQLGKPLHTLDLGDNGSQAIKRLREELGAKFIEKSLIKLRKREGYWLDVDANNIHTLPE